MEAQIFSETKLYLCFDFNVFQKCAKISYKDGWLKINQRARKENSNFLKKMAEYLVCRYLSTKGLSKESGNFYRNIVKKHVRNTFTTSYEERFSTLITTFFAISKVALSPNVKNILMITTLSKEKVNET